MMHAQASAGPPSGSISRTRQPCGPRLPGAAAGAHSAPAGQETAVIREMTDAEFRRFANFIHENCGIKMPAAKKTMLQTRLHKRLRLHKFSTYSQYADHVFGGADAGVELAHMIDAVTTNKTDFFREPGHFEFLISHILAPPAGRRNTAGRKPLKFWSAGCSSGEEPYTLAMVLAEHALFDPDFRYEILGTDISTRVLQAAAMAVYTMEKIAPVPLALRKKYLLRSRENPLVRIVPELRARVTYRRLNFMDQAYAFAGPFDVIFCRNVIIYFDHPTQEMILKRICRHLVPGGFLFMGHSETLNGMALPLVQVAPTVYRKPHDGG